MFFHMEEWIVYCTLQHWDIGSCHIGCCNWGEQPSLICDNHGTIGHVSNVICYLKSPRMLFRILQRSEKVLGELLELPEYRLDVLPIPLKWTPDSFFQVGGCPKIDMIIKLIRLYVWFLGVKYNKVNWYMESFGNLLYL